MNDFPGFSAEDLWNAAIEALEIMNMEVTTAAIEALLLPPRTLKEDVD